MRVYFKMSVYTSRIYLLFSVYLQSSIRWCHLFGFHDVTLLSKSAWVRTSMLRCRMPWQGNSDVTIDRFDVRAHLDFISDVSDSADPKWVVIPVSVNVSVDTIIWIVPGFIGSFVDNINLFFTLWFVICFILLFSRPTFSYFLERTLSPDRSFHAV